MHQLWQCQSVNPTQLLIPNDLIIIFLGCILAAPKKKLVKKHPKRPRFFGTEFHSEFCQLCLCLEVASPVAARRHGVVDHAGSLALLVETKRHRFTGLDWSENNVGCHDAMVNSGKSGSYPVEQGYQVDCIDWKRQHNIFLCSANPFLYVSTCMTFLNLFRNSHLNILSISWEVLEKSCFGSKSL